MPLNVNTIKRAQSFLDEYFYNDPKYEKFLKSIAKYSHLEMETMDLELIEFLNKSYEELIIHENDNKFNLSLRISLECIMFSNLHDIIMPIIISHCKEEDSHLYEKSLEFCEKNVSAEQFGACEDYAIPLYAGIVELAMLDTHKTPIEKVNCLCTTYDLLYAELKSNIAEFVSETSDADNHVTVVEKADMIPVLMTVIVKAKQLYLYSNLYYINMFLWTCNDANNVSHVLEMFTKAIEKISVSTEETLRPSSANNCKELDTKTTFEILFEAEMDGGKSKCKSLLDLRKRKLVEQIRLSTGCND